MRVLPVLRDVKRARLAIQGQPSPSKPVIPEYDFSIARFGLPSIGKAYAAGQSQLKESNADDADQTD